MKTVKMTYKVISKNNPFAQKTISATVNNNSNAFTQFEEEVRAKLGDSVEFNHVGKVVIC
jgi:hypothetical protein